MLMADADGATDIREVAKLEDRMKIINVKGYGVVVGSRAHLQDDAVASVCLPTLAHFPVSFSFSTFQSSMISVSSRLFLKIVAANVLAQSPHVRLSRSCKSSFRRGDQ